MEVRRISITLRGKNYVISTSEKEEFICRAAELLDQAMSHLSAHSSLKRDDQVVLFAAIQITVDMMRKLEEYKAQVDEKAGYLVSALNSVG